MSEHRVVITDFLTGSLEREREVLSDVAEVSACGARTEEELVGRVEDADALMVYHTIRLSRRTIDRLDRCRLIVRCGVGFDNVDHAFARQRGIPVANVPDYGSEEVADSAVGMALALARGVACLNSRLRAGEGPWSHSQVAPLQRLRGQSFGVVGLGRIGTAAALRAKAFGMEVLFYDPYKPDGFDKALGITRVESLEELLTRSRIVSLHCPLTPETRHLVDEAALARMPEGSYVVNTARGEVLDTAAVAEAIASGHLAGAGVDVFPREPPLDDPLVKVWRDPEHPAHHRVLVTPHAAFYSEAGVEEMRVKGAEACRRAILGLPLRSVVNG
ncbi:MAG: C-terminal binding protein [Deltaproteobacteria bacterium]|nr:C-terminal binding protein [Deltaproteobacteria bacterium]